MEPFTYFLDPTHPLSHWSNEAGACYFCDSSGPGFAGPYYGLEEISWVCEPCLRAGRLAEVDSCSCEGDVRALAKQIAELKPELSEQEQEVLRTERCNELVYRTPGLYTWQDFFWPAHCGDFCQFVEELGKPEIRELARDEDPEQWFHARADRTEHGVWEAVRERSARSHPTESFDLTVYRFVCRECEETVLRWDSS